MSEIALADAARESLLKVEELREQREDIQQQQAEEILALVPESRRREFKRLLTSQKAQLAAVNVRVEAAEKIAKQRTVELGCTVKGTALKISYSPGQEEANIDRLKGMIPAYPNIADAISTGSPSTRICKLSKEDLAQQA